MMHPFATFASLVLLATTAQAGIYVSATPLVLPPRLTRHAVHVTRCNHHLHGGSILRGGLG